MDFAYISFHDLSEAQRCIEYMNKSQIDGIEIKVQQTLPYTKPRPASFRRNVRSFRRGGRWRRSASPRRGKDKSPELNQTTKKRSASRSSSRSPKRFKGEIQPEILPNKNNNK